MAISSEYKEFIVELLVPLGNVNIRPMFGGGGVYLQGVMFALIADEALYFKADESNIPDFISEEMGPFEFSGKSGGLVRTSYWQVPDRCLDASDELKMWAVKAYSVACAVQKQKNRKNQRKSSNSRRLLRLRLTQGQIR